MEFLIKWKLDGLPSSWENIHNLDGCALSLARFFLKREMVSAALGTDDIEKLLDSLVDENTETGICSSSIIADQETEGQRKAQKSDESAVIPIFTEGCAPQGIFHNGESWLLQIAKLVKRAAEVGPTHVLISQILEFLNRIDPFKTMHYNHNPNPFFSQFPSPLAMSPYFGVQLMGPPLTQGQQLPMRKRESGAQRRKRWSEEKRKAMTEVKRKKKELKLARI